jgi:hypothetical protein
MPSAAQAASGRLRQQFVTFLVQPLCQRRPWCSTFDKQTNSNQAMILTMH